MIEEFKKRIIGQDHIFPPLCDCIRIGEAGLSPDDMVRGAFLFLGPTGTGKTETSKVMAELLNVPLIRFDMSEYSVPEKWLSDFSYKLEGKTKGVILLDEIEKGSKDIFDYFLQILSEAKITYDRKEIILKDFYIVMTSNIGSKNLILDENFRVMKSIVMIKVKSFFRPEFLGRFDSSCIFCFKPFDYYGLKSVATLKVNEEIARLAEKGYHVSCTEKVIDLLTFQTVLQRDLGARPLLRNIQKTFALLILDSGKKSGTIEIVDNRLTFV